MVFDSVKTMEVLSTAATSSTPVTRRLRQYENCPVRKGAIASKQTNGTYTLIIPGRPNRPMTKIAAIHNPQLAATCQLGRSRANNNAVSTSGSNLGSHKVWIPAQPLATEFP